MTHQEPPQEGPDTAPEMHATGPSAPPPPSLPGGAMKGAFEVSAEDDVPAATPVDDGVAASLTQALRTMYETVVDEPLPDAFAQLLSQLDDSDG